MRRSVQALSAAVLTTLALAVPAGASDHLMRINEILPSGPGGAQFVEMRDTSPEPFPLPPYKLIVYSSSGEVVGRVPLPEGELAAAGTSPYLVANGAQGGTPDEPLSVTLPATSGQVCYTRLPAEVKIHCVSYGCPSPTPFDSEGGSRQALSFGSGQSLQRQESGAFGPGVPTPDAANSSLPVVPCGIPVPGLGGGPDNTRPIAKLGGKRRQRLSKLTVTVTVNEDGSVVTRGYVKVGRRKLAFRKVKRTVRAGRKISVRLKLSRRARATVRVALRHGRRATALVKVRATDGSGNASGEKRTIRVRP